MADPFNFLVARPTVIRRQHIHDNRTGTERAALRAFRSHGFHHTGNHHLQTTASATGRNVDVYASGTLSWRNDVFAIENFTAGEFLDLLNGIQHTTGDVLERSLDRGRRFAAVSLAVLVPELLNENRFGRSTA